MSAVILRRPRTAVLLATPLLFSGGSALMLRVIASVFVAHRTTAWGRARELAAAWRRAQLRHHPHRVT
jgi:hypothetical protein